MTCVHPTAVVDGGARLGDDVSVGPYSIVGPDVRLGAGVRVGAHVVIEGHTEIGEGCVIHPFAALGGPPQHAGHKGEPTRLVVRI